ncbi:MAG: adenylosuccinate synthase [Acidobacteria bacterium]|nr:adenylosuccinate synthase [Acidobacteriota bacterium]
MRNVAVIGAQWGDEGKGKVVDVLARHFGCVVRFQGGNNAGHSVQFGGRHFALHLLPSGILEGQNINLIGNGVVVDPCALVAEMTGLEQQGISISADLFKISDRAHLVMPYHRILDQFRDTSPTQRKIGTTGKGIGPTYEWKAARRGLRFCDALARSGFEQRLRIELEQAQRVYSNVSELTTLTVDDVMDQVWPAIERLQPHVIDGVSFLYELNQNKTSILFEGAQATLLDVDFGTYPYVTSSNSCAVGITAGSGVPPRCIHGVIGITKAYTTRVGEGPFPTELTGSTGDALRVRGHEYGTTTGRPRRCGWLDLVALRYACQLNGYDSLAVMKLDVLDECDQIEFCVAYEIDGKTVTQFPASLHHLQKVKPIYESLPGWKTSTNTCKTLEGLPPAAQAYVQAVESFVSCPVDLVSVGPDRSETITRENGLFRRLGVS